MSDWSLQKLLSGLHDDIQQQLSTVRATLGHPGTKGDASAVAPIPTRLLSPMVTRLL